MREVTVYGNSQNINLINDNKLNVWFFGFLIFFWNLDRWALPSQIGRRVILFKSLRSRNTLVLHKSFPEIFVFPFSDIYCCVTVTEHVKTINGANLSWCSKVISVIVRQLSSFPLIEYHEDGREEKQKHAGYYRQRSRYCWEIIKAKVS